MKERFMKFGVCLVVLPILYLLIIFVALMLLTLPIIAFIYPEGIKLGDKK